MGSRILYLLVYFGVCNVKWWSSLIKPCDSLACCLSGFGEARLMQLAKHMNLTLITVINSVS